MDQDITKTHQQHQYEQIYQGDAYDYGMPDRKITDGVNFENMAILSLGCGNGNDVWYLTPKNTVVGLDYAFSGLKMGQVHGLNGVIGDLNIHRNLPFKDESFDVVICKDILEHVLEPLDILREAKRILKKDGHIIISVPNHFYLTFRLRILLGKGLIWKSLGSDHSRFYDEWNYMHIRFFTYKGFKNFLEAAGLKPEKWFWDFGTLAHYHNPDLYFEPQLWKLHTGKKISRKAKIGLDIILPLWKLFNTIFPKKLRGFIVSLAPGLLCAGFYVKSKKLVSE